MSKPYRTSDFLARRADAAQKAVKDAARVERLARARADIERTLAVTPILARTKLGRIARLRPYACVRRRGRGGDTACGEGLSTRVQTGSKTTDGRTPR